MIVYSDTGKIWALDVNKGRLRILKDTAKLHGLDEMIIDVHADLRQYAEDTSAKYDKVLLDAPCSGLGVLSKVGKTWCVCMECGFNAIGNKEGGVNLVAQTESGEVDLVLRERQLFWFTC
ncbi:hypothetical protein EJB05_50733, partial [Eragrostis curvula]